MTGMVRSPSATQVATQGGRADPTIRFSPSILPLHARSNSIETLLPILY